MIEMKTTELIGPALDWAVAKADGFESQLDMDGYYDTRLGREVTTALYLGAANVWRPSTDWSQGGPLIERERIATAMVDDAEPVLWRGQLSDPFRALPSVQSHIGPTPLIAAMRCLCAAKLGEVVTVPKELLS